MWLRLIKRTHKESFIFYSSCWKKLLNNVSAGFEQIPSIPSTVSLNTGFKIWNHVGSHAPVKPESLFFLSLNFLQSFFMVLFLLSSFFMSKLSDSLPFSHFSFEALNGSSIKAVFNSSRIASNTYFVAVFLMSFVLMWA